MVVQHNLTAMNSNRMLGITQNLQAKSSEKLSSGYRINRAADDAAGLAISEKMRKQINGLDQASSNAQDGVSAVQTAEGALTEVHSMLQRMNELAVQAANGTNSESDRAAIQAEIEQLTTEIDRVAETTKFNETYLLKGADDGTGTTKNVAAHDAGLVGKLEDNKNGTYTFDAADLEVGDKVTIAGKEYTIAESADAEDYIDIKNVKAHTPATGNKYVKEDGTTYIYYAKDAKDANGIEVAVAGWYQDGNSTGTKEDNIEALDPAAGDTLIANGTSQTVVGTVGDKDYTIKELKAIQDELKGDLEKTDKIQIGGIEYTIAEKTEVAANKLTVDAAVAMLKEGEEVISVTDNKYYYVLPKASENTSEISLNKAYEMMAKELETASSIGTDKAAKVTNNGDGTFTIEQGTVGIKESLNFNLHVGADADMTNKITVDIEAMSAANLGIKDLKVTDGKATYAIDVIADAITKVSEQRSALGAIQNRLEHTISNLDNVVENTTAAESRIRDTDMAEEMVEYSKNNILAQAGQSMLAQANQSTQGVLSLLG